jgi:hypothetical protein
MRNDIGGYSHYIAWIEAVIKTTWSITEPWAFIADSMLPRYPSAGLQHQSESCEGRKSWSGLALEAESDQGSRLLSVSLKNPLATGTAVLNDHSLTQGDPWLNQPCFGHIVIF